MEEKSNVSSAMLSLCCFFLYIYLSFHYLSVLLFYHSTSLTLLICVYACACGVALKSMQSYKHMPNYLFVAPSSSAIDFVAMCAANVFEIGHRYEGARGSTFNRGHSVTSLWTYFILNAQGTRVHIN